MISKRIVLLLVLFTYCIDYAQETVSNYKAFTGSAVYNNTNYILTRKFERSGKTCYLAVNPATMETTVIPLVDKDITPKKWADLLIQYKNTPYINALLTAQKQSFSLQDAGIIHGFPKEKGITLTIDLCPSHKRLDRIIFTSLVTEFKKIETPVPLALSITGRFMLTHSDDINWLKELVKADDLKITWINHTYNHHYDPKVPLQDNFLLAPGTDLDFEILGTEIALLQNGLMPSVFFRFPGLVSDNKIVTKITDFGLIPIGSDAWLAKGQQAQQGSIVLIHGNGNEPIGVNDFITLLKNKQDLVQSKQWLLYDLRESVDDEFRE
jgi:hypothetical protein